MPELISATLRYMWKVTQTGFEEEVASMNNLVLSRVLILMDQIKNFGHYSACHNFMQTSNIHYEGDNVQTIMSNT